jgi:hypothetical protein
MKEEVIGKWKIVEMEQWDQDYVDMEEPGHITLKKGGSGSFHFGCVEASLDCSYQASIDRVDFTFDGCDEGDQVTGRGWAKIERKQLVGQIVFHLGDESGFRARKGR